MICNIFAALLCTAGVHADRQTDAVSRSTNGKPISEICIQNHCIHCLRICLFLA